MRVKYILILMVASKISFAQPLNYPIFNDFVQYSSSINAYSNICVKNFNDEEAKSELFELIILLQEKTNLSEKDIFKLKDKYSSINKSTVSQLIQLGIKKNRVLCPNYLKIFERFDVKKNTALDKLIEITYK
tara:strand:- start:85 stop:480 length:396 start_codon:yes stop_codon:yes gene_type:complete